MNSRRKRNLAAQPPPRVKRPRRTQPQLGDLILEISGADPTTRHTPPLTLSQLACREAPAGASCPWFFPLSGLLDALGLRDSPEPGLRIDADFDNTTFAIADGDQWLDMLHEIWGRDMGGQDPPALRLRVIRAPATMPGGEKLFRAPGPAPAPKTTATGMPAADS